MKSTAYVMGFIFGIVIVFVAFAIIGAILKKKNKNVEYDERQIAKRGEAYKTGFKAFTVCEILEVCNEAGFGFHVMDGALLHLSILLIGILAFVLHAIWNDAYFQANEKKNIWAVIIIAAIVLNLVCFFCRDMTTLRTEDGLLTYAFINLEVSILCLIVFINVIIKNLVEKKSVKEDEE